MKRDTCKACLFKYKFPRFLGEGALMVIIIPSIYTSVNQGSTDLSVRRGLAGLSAFPLQGVPCACPATSQTMADGPSRDPRCRAPAACYQRGLALHRVLAGPGHAVRHRPMHGLRSRAAPLPRLSQATWEERGRGPAVPAWSIWRGRCRVSRGSWAEACRASSRTCPRRVARLSGGRPLCSGALDRGQSSGQPTAGQGREPLGVGCQASEPCVQACGHQGVSSCKVPWGGTVPWG
jgi:hypothetical protein